LPDAFTMVNLAAVDDAAPANGFGDRWEARVAREALRSFEAGPEGLEFLALVAHHPADGEPVADEWTEQ
jgi:hypothetical protein